jgi:hypothetical protein
MPSPLAIDLAHHINKRFYLDTDEADAERTLIELIDRRIEELILLPAKRLDEMEATFDLNGVPSPARGAKQ